MTRISVAVVNQFSEQLQVTLKADRFQKFTFCCAVPGLYRSEMNGKDLFFPF